MRLFVGAMSIRLPKRCHNPLIVPVFPQFLEWGIADNKAEMCSFSWCYPSSSFYFQIITRSVRVSNPRRLYMMYFQMMRNVPLRVEALNQHRKFIRKCNVKTNYKESIYSNNKTLLKVTFTFTNILINCCDEPFVAGTAV